jgi:hypothetical protein
MRLASRCRIATPERLAAIVGLRQPGSAVTAADLSCLAQMAGTTSGSLEAVVYRPTVRPAHQMFLGATVSREFIRLDVRRFCPACLGERLHHRARWDLALTTACPDHRIRLVERCPGCGRSTAWNSGLDRCACDVEFSTVRTAAVTAREALVDARLLEVLAPGRPSWLAAALAACEPGDLLRLLMCLGMFTTGWPRQRRIEALVSAGPEAVARVTSAGMAVFEGWPVSLQGFLSRQEAGAAGRRGRYGSRKSLGPFYEWLTLMEKGPVKTALAGAAAGYVAADPELSRMSHRSRLLKSDEAAPALGLVDTAVLLGTSGVGVRRLMAAALLPEVASRGRGVPMLISRSAVEQLAAVVPDAMTLAQTSRALCISRARVRTLVEAGVLHPVHRAASEGWGRWAFARADVVFLPDKLCGEVPPNCLGRTVGFNTAAEALRLRGMGLGAMLAMVADGRLPVRYRDRSAIGLKQLRFLAADVHGLCRTLENAGLTVQAAAERLGLKWEVVINLIARGLLPSRDGLVSAEDVDAFLSRHVTGGQLAREQGTSPRSLARRLDALNIRPVVGPNVDGSRQNIYRRSV